MQFGVREICDVVFKAKSTMKVGKRTFFKGEPVIYFDSLTTSSVEGAATTVYAQGGRGNARLISWEGERTVTFTMEDALMSPVGFMILSGAGLINEASATEVIYQHKTEITDKVEVNGRTVTITLAEAASTNENAGVYVFDLDDDGHIYSEPYIPATINGTTITLKTTDDITTGGFATGMPVLVDYYVERTSGATQIDITPESFGGNFYIEASTLFRDKATGVDMPAEFVIPSGKVQSNFTFTMAASGDPSTFTFTVDAFPDYTRFNKTKKVLAALQIIDPTAIEDTARQRTIHGATPESGASTGTPTYTYTEVSEPTGNPSELGYYELNGSDYVLSADTEVNAGKTYYTRSENAAG